MLRVRHVSSEPWEELPIAARPAMQPPGVGEIVRRVVLDQHNVAHQSSAPVHALEEVMAEQGPFGNSPGETTRERLDIVDALAGVDAFAEQILIHVRDSTRVRIECITA